MAGVGLCGSSGGPYGCAATLLAMGATLGDFGRRAGAFTLEIDGGISAFRAARPAVVMLSSGGVERNALIGDDEEARKRDIPIVQLNPGGAIAARQQGDEHMIVAWLSYYRQDCIQQKYSECCSRSQKGPYRTETVSIRKMAIFAVAVRIQCCAAHHLRTCDIGATHAQAP